MDADWNFCNLFVTVFIPGPIIMGRLFDSACLLWKKTCGEEENCLNYNMDRYRWFFQKPWHSSVWHDIMQWNETLLKTLHQQYVAIPTTAPALIFLDLLIMLYKPVLSWGGAVWSDGSWYEVWVGHQWQIQDFTEGGVNRWPIFPKNGWKWRNFGLEEGAQVPGSPRSANGHLATWLGERDLGWVRLRVTYPPCWGGGQLPTWLGDQIRWVMVCGWRVRWLMARTTAPLWTE